MRFKADENVPAAVATRLVAAGHDAMRVLERLIDLILPFLDREPLVGHLWIVEDTRVRIRSGG